MNPYRRIDQAVNELGRTEAVRHLAAVIGFDGTYAPPGQIRLYTQAAEQLLDASDTLEELAQMQADGEAPTLLTLLRGITEDRRPDRHHTHTAA